MYRPINPNRNSGLRAGTAILIAMYCAQVWAAPAPWQRWESKIDARRVCAQVSPGPGWKHVAGPFKDSHCEKLVHAK